MDTPVAGRGLVYSSAPPYNLTGVLFEEGTAGYDIVLKLDATIGLAKRDSEPSKITAQDRRFLESLHIQVDQEVLEEERRPPKLDVTPQDIRFLKSLKISLDDSL